MRKYSQKEDKQYVSYSLDEGVCVMIEDTFPVPAPFTAATTTSSVSPRLLTV